MANFFNPYMASPDFGQGISSLIQDIMLQRLLKQQQGPKMETGADVLTRPIPPAQAQQMPQTSIQQTPLQNGYARRSSDMATQVMGIPTKSGNLDSAISALMRYLSMNPSR